MTSVDPDTPGRRLSAVDSRSAEGEALVHAFNGMLDRLESARHEAARTALAAQEAERLRVAQELHDEIGQTLTAVTIKAERAADGDAAPRVRGAPAGGRRRPGEPRRGAPDRARAAARGARRPRPRQRSDRALLACRRPRRAARQAGAPGEPASAARDVELVIYRVAQESITNAIRHAHADTITVSLRGTQIGLVSLATTATACRPRRQSGTAGIAGMRERALLVGGGSRSSPCPRAPRSG